LKHCFQPPHPVTPSPPTQNPPPPFPAEEKRPAVDKRKVRQGGLWSAWTDSLS